MDPEKLSFPCPACQGVLRIPYQLAGVRGPCPNCNTEIVAPIPGSQTPASIVEAIPQAALDGVAPFPTPVAPPAQPAPPAQLPQQAPAQNPLTPVAVPLPRREEPAPAPQPQTPWPPQQPAAHQAQTTQAPASPPQGPIPVPQAETAIPQPTPAPEQPQKRKKSSKPKSKKASKRSGIPPLIKLVLPLAILAAIAVGAVKFWPQISSRLGIGSDQPTPVSEQPPSPAPTTSDDPSGFKYIDEVESKTEPVAPSPDARFSTEPKPIFLEEDFPKARAVGEGKNAGGEARKVLDKALAATTVEEMAKHVLAPSRMLPKMKAYYKDQSPAVKPTSIIYEYADGLPEDQEPNSTHTFYLATTKQTLRFPIALQETKDGPKLDWESYIEMHDDHLGQFLAAPTTDSRTFHVILSRSHYFRGDVPELGSKDCFRVSTPIAGSEGYAFVEKDSKIAKECEAFAWDVVGFAIIELAWTTPKGGNGKPYLTIQRVLQTNWRAEDAT